MAGSRSNNSPTSALQRPPVTPLSTTSLSSITSSRTLSNASNSHSPTSPRLSPRVQLVPHARAASFDISLSDIERELLNKTNFDNFDLSSQDFDFEDIFTYDKPQRKLNRVVEVSTPSRDRDWSNFSFSHYSAAVAARNKVNRSKSGEKQVRAQGNGRKVTSN